MKTSAMIDELTAAAAAITPAQEAWLVAQGVEARVQRRAGAWGRGRVHPDRPDRGLYLPADCRRGAGGTVDVLVQAVLRRPLTAGRGRFCLLDLLAWDPRSPSSWWLRIGGGPLLLGQGALDDAAAEDWDEHLMGGPRPGLRLYPTPLAWLAAGAPDDGAVVLDDGGRPWRDLFAGVERITVAEEAFAAEVHKRLRKRPPAPRLPEVWLAGGGDRTTEEEKRSVA